MFLDGFSIAALYMSEVERLNKLRSRLENAQARILARSHLLITGGSFRFPQILDLFQTLKIGTSQWLSVENLDF